MTAVAAGQIVFAQVALSTNNGNGFAPAIVINPGGGSGPNYICDLAVFRTDGSDSLRQWAGEVFLGVTVYPTRGAIVGPAASMAASVT